MCVVLKRKSVRMLKLNFLTGHRPLKALYGQTRNFSHLPAFCPQVAEFRMVMRDNAMRL